MRCSPAARQHSLIWAYSLLIIIVAGVGNTLAQTTTETDSLLHGIYAGDVAANDSSVEVLPTTKIAAPRKATFRGFIDQSNKTVAPASTLIVEEAPDWAKAVFYGVS